MPSRRIVGIGTKFGAGTSSSSMTSITDHGHTHLIEGAIWQSKNELSLDITDHSQAKLGPKFPAAPEDYDSGPRRKIPRPRTRA